MINHLEVSTVTALVCVASALALGRANAALRHLILLIGVLRFAVYTPWLAAAGERLGRFVPAHHAPAPRLVHVTLRLLLPEGHAPARNSPSARHNWTEWKEAAWWLWYSGAGFGLGTLLGRMISPIRPVREATFWERDAFLQVASATGMEGRAELWIVSSDQVPGAQGWLRPRVLLPDGLTNALSEEEVDTVLAHELAHLRRRDPLIAGAVRAITSVFWFHPLLWWMERRMLAERETACDEMVLAGGARPEDYVAGIAKVCRNVLGRHMPDAEPGYASFTGANLARRLEHILSPEARRTWPRRIGLIPAALALIAIFIPVAGGLLRAQTAQGQADGLYQAAETLRRSGNVNAALPLFLEAGNAGNRAAALQAALLLDGTGRMAEARSQYEKVLKDDPSSFVALNNLAYILAQDAAVEDKASLDVALTYAERAHELKLDSLDIDDTLGWIYVKRNMPDQAILALRDPVLKSPNTWAFRSHMAQALDEKIDAPDWMRELRGVIFGTSRESELRLQELLQSIGR